MIVDSHLHIGNILDFNLTEEETIAGMEKYGVDYGIVSCLESSEFDHNFNQLPPEVQVSQKDSNRRTLNFVQNNPQRLQAQFWIKANLEGYDDWIAEFLVTNQEYFCGLKMHPFHSMLKPTSKKVKPYLELAEQLEFPVAIHTAGDKYSDPEHVYQLAQDYPNLNFIMVHMGLGTDNQKAISLIEKLPNLYGDTTWVEPESVLDAIEKCGSHKIIFGTDAPIDGVDTYKSYFDLIEILKTELSAVEYQNIMFKNAIKLFDLNIKKID
jgi:predicted TIM-barrel fold metal-dependent hydrolase